MAVVPGRVRTSRGRTEPVVQEFSVPRVVQIDAATNLTDLVWDNAEQAPDTVQFSRRTPDGWGEVTCATFRDEVSALARGLIAAGIQPGDRVGLMSKTRYEWTLVDFAIWAAGAITVPIYETSSAEQVQWILADSGALAVVVETAAHEATVAQVRDRVPDLNEVWQIDSGALDRLVASRAAGTPGGGGRGGGTAGAGALAAPILTSWSTPRPPGPAPTPRPRSPAPAPPAAR